MHQAKELDASYDEYVGVQQALTVLREIEKMPGNVISSPLRERVRDAARGLGCVRKHGDADRT